MVFVRGCAFPEERYFDVANQIWYAPLPDGTVRAGFTTIALVLAGEMLVFTPKRIGISFGKGRSFATIEGGKWAGSARAAFPGTVLAHNEALVARPTIANIDPYGDGWLVVMRPDIPDWKTGLVTGAAVADAFEAWMEAEEVAGCGG